MVKRILVLIAAVMSMVSVGPAAATDLMFHSNRIVVTIVGEGPDVVLVPGMTSSPSAWRTVTPNVPGYRYHLVQVKGFAGTEPDGNAEGQVVAPAAEEIARYIRESRLNSPALVGHSMGGTIGMMVAARHPTSVSRVMVVDQLPFMGAIYGPPGTTSESVRPTAGKLREQMATAAVEAYHAQLQKMTEAMVKDPEQRALVLAEAKASSRAMVANAFYELIITDLRAELPKIAVPVTVLYVTPAGTPFTDEQVDAVYKASYDGLKDGTLVRVPDAAHFIMSDNQPRFQAELKSFLTSQKQ